MVLDEINTIHSHWNNLQQPSHASSGIAPTLRTLLTAIDLGWQVDEPVEVTASRNDAWIYSFVLTNPSLGQACRIYTSASPEIDQFIERNHYQVIEISMHEML